MARRAIIRSRTLNTDVAQLEEMVKDQFNEIWKEHIDELETLAASIQDDATNLSPVLTGKLKGSINVRVSKSRRYPGIIAHASAKHRGFDYALIQDINEEYSHEVGTAHYLSGPFAQKLELWYYKKTRRSLDMPDELLDAIDYIETYAASLEDEE